ncbi:hypothetical protein BX616_006833, partial [Lobosporangium transversale]
MTLTSDTPAPSSSFKYPQPDKFDGKRDGFSATTWLRSMRRFFVGASVPDAARTVLIRYRLSSLTMTATVIDYVAEARELLTALLADESTTGGRKAIEDFAFICFVQGCPPALNHLLRALQVTQTLTVYQLFEAAGQFDRVYIFQPDNKASTRQTPSTQASVVATQLQAARDPMAMELDNLRIELNALRKHLHSRSSLAPLTPAERTELIRRGACFKCRQDGNRANECPGRRGARNFNSLSLPEGNVPDSVSGKAPS